MRRIFMGVFIAAVAVTFLLNGPLLDLIGWKFTAESGPFLMKFHPSLFLMIIALGLAIIIAPMRIIRSAVSPVMALFLIATLCLFAKATQLVLGGVTGGEFSLVTANFLTPALIVLCATLVPSFDFRRGSVIVRAFFVVNSLMALAERLVGHRFIPSILDRFHDPRSAAFVGHPLNGSLLTGLMIIYLATARRDRMPVWSRFGEIALHAAAMFAFGGRSSLVFVPVILVLSALVARNRAGEARINPIQRLLPFALVGLGIVLTMLPIPFVDQTLDRFTNDNGSAQTRNAAMQMLTTIPTSELLSGLNVSERMSLSRFYNTQQGIELSWVALCLEFGLLALLPMLIAFPLFLINTARGLDRSAFYMALFFLLVTIGSLSIGVKSLLVEQLVFMMYFLAQPRTMSSPLQNLRATLRAADREQGFASPPAPRS